MLKHSEMPLYVLLHIYNLVGKWPPHRHIQTVQIALENEWNPKYICWLWKLVKTPQQMAFQYLPRLSIKSRAKKRCNNKKYACCTVLCRTEPSSLNAAPSCCTTCWARLLLGWESKGNKAQSTGQWQLLPQGIQGIEPPSFHGGHCPPHLQQEQQSTSWNGAAGSRSCLSCLTFMNNPSPSPSKKGIQGKGINSAHSNSF